jgi:hypothetical protein
LLAASKSSTALVLQYSPDPRFGVITTSVVTSLISTNTPGKYRLSIKYGNASIPVENDGHLTVSAAAVASPYRSYVKGDGKGAIQVSGLTACCWHCINNNIERQSL